jgi:catalase (peroxidase I)
LHFPAQALADRAQLLRLAALEMTVLVGEVGTALRLTAEA